MSGGGGHAPNLTVLAFDEFEFEPDGRDAFAGANWRVARGDVWLRFEQPRSTGEGFPALDDESFLQFAESFGRGNIFDLRPIKPRVPVARVEQLLIQRGFITEQEQALRIRIEPSDRINVFGENEISERAIGRAIGRKLRNHAVGFMEGDEHS